MLAYAAVDDIFARPWKALKVALFGIKTEGPMAPDIALDHARPPPKYVFEKRKQEQVAVLHQSKGAAGGRSSAA